MAVLQKVPRRRYHLFEFQDLAWFPALLRDSITNWLRDEVVVGGRVYESVAPLVAQLLKSQPTSQLVDLCSGGSGPWEYLKAEIDDLCRSDGCGAPTLTLTDLYPNAEAFRVAAEHLGQGVNFCLEPVDSRRVPHDLPGVRTMFSAFHHLQPPAARAVLADAATSRQPIGIFDFTRGTRGSNFLLAWHVPLSLVRRVHTWRPRNRILLLCTYVLPVTLITCAWDAIASNLRMYLSEDLARMTADLGSESYRWETGVIGASDPNPITYVLGYPVGHGLSAAAGEVEPV